MAWVGRAQVCTFLAESAGKHKNVPKFPFMSRQGKNNEKREKSRVYLVRLDSRGRLKELPRELFLSHVRSRLLEVSKRTDRAVYGRANIRYKVWVEASTGALRFTAKNVPSGSSGKLKSAFGLVKRVYLYKVKYNRVRENGQTIFVPEYPMRDELDAQVCI